MSPFLKVSSCAAVESPCLPSRAKDTGAYAGRGTEDTDWDNALQHQPTWTPLGRKLVVVAPHPDDETFGAGGLLHTYARLGAEVTVISVTDGEASHPEWYDLAAVRRRELGQALQFLGGARIKLVHLGFPDGLVSSHEKSLERIINEHVSEDVTLITSFENDGHPDHDCVGRVCQSVAAAENATLVRYPIWAWHHSQPQAFTDARWGRFVLTDAARAAKAHAMGCFRSQTESFFGSIIVSKHVLNYFRRPYEAFLL